MKMRSLYSCVALHKSLLLTITILVATGSCMKSPDGKSTGKLIPENTFISILTDINLATGLLSLPEIRYEFGGRDSVLNYMDIIESHGYTYEAMNNTMNYYFVSKPKKLIRIYDQIIKNLNEKESAIRDEMTRIEEAAARRAVNYNVYELPDPYSTEDPGINQIIHSSGTYNLTFTVTIFPDDNSINPHFRAWLVNADSTVTGKKKWLAPVKYFKDGHPHQVVYNGHIETKQPLMMMVRFYNYENEMAEWDKHARIELFSFNYITNPE